MSRWKRPLTAKEVRQIAKALGFVKGSTHGGHEHWTRDTPPPFRKLTIDAHIAPFSDYLIKCMASQAGVSIRDFYEALDR